jgi:hypothetical protein
MSSIKVNRSYNKFIDVAGNTHKTRYTPGYTANVSEDDCKDPERMAAVLSALHKRVQDLEATKTPDFIDFEKRLTASGTVTLSHYFGCPVRYNVIYWKGSSMPNLNVNETSSDLNNLVLNTTVAGLAIIRVEKNQHTPTKGT